MEGGEGVVSFSFYFVSLARTVVFFSTSKLEVKFYCHPHDSTRTAEITQEIQSCY